ncbi:hypothetical protein DPMN_117826 [Dreissena polymorpha]|uniref:Uncharacterized protein n=1 Tax=Dreissena polymorpha TaxID=45954 RepID=A0A9D4GJ32_DREPO|nr:hypothetical protein DPMN_117826 [Dreissena polymorpha]
MNKKPSKVDQESLRGINITDANYWTSTAWCELVEISIVNCFRKCQLVEIISASSLRDNVVFLHLKMRTTRRMTYL